MSDEMKPESRARRELPSKEEMGSVIRAALKNQGVTVGLGRCEVVAGVLLALLSEENPPSGAEGI